MTKSLTLLPCILLALGLLAGADPAGAAPGKAYDQSRIYGKKDTAGRLYMRRSPGMPWRGDGKPADLDRIRCGEALLTLKEQGRWVGNLESDGTCGEEAEPAEWVTENFLRYLESSRP